MSRSRSRLIRILLGIALVAHAAMTSAEDGAYHLYAGDSLLISVYSHRDLSGVYLLDEQGRLNFPLIGPLVASGQTSEEIRDSLAERLKERVDGEVEVVVSVIEYRPVYIDGDVVNPGAYPYRPGMTVTIAATLAGGRQSVRTSSNLMGLSQEQEQFEQLLDIYRVNVAREARLLAEMARKKIVSFPEDLEISANSYPRVREILDNERAIMASRLSLQTIQSESLRQRVKGLEQVISELESQKESITTRRKLYEQQFEDIKKITAQGVLPKSTLLRLQITATTLEQELRAADITLIQSRQSVKGMRTQLKNLPIKRKASIVAALQEVQDKLAQSRIQFDQSIRRLAALNAQAPPGSAPEDRDTPIQVSITRVTETAAQSLSTVEADWDSPVLPGDVIRIPFPDFSTPDFFDGGLPERVKTSIE